MTSLKVRPKIACIDAWGGCGIACEWVRSGRADGEALQYFREHLAAALDCAKIAYQMAVSKITKDTLKSLGDLRKAVTEETSKPQRLPARRSQRFRLR